MNQVEESYFKTRGLDASGRDTGESFGKVQRSITNKSKTASNANKETAETKPEDKTNTEAPPSPTKVSK